MVFLKHLLLAAVNEIEVGGPLIWHQYSLFCNLWHSPQVLIWHYFAFCLLLFFCFGLVLWVSESLRHILQLSGGYSHRPSATSNPTCSLALEADRKSLLSNELVASQTQADIWGKHTHWNSFITSRLWKDNHDIYISLITCNTLALRVGVFGVSLFVFKATF